jgi:hypothetical protein
MRKIKTLILTFFYLLSMGIMTAGEIIRITNLNFHLVPRGRSIDAIYGDWIIRNDKVIAIIGDAISGREANMRAQSVQGAVIDFTTLADDNDYLVAFYPQGYPIGDSRSSPKDFANDISVEISQGNEVKLKVTHYPTYKMPYLSITEYSLRDGENFLRINTTILNSSSEIVEILAADKIRLDQDITDSSPVGSHNLAFIYNKWFNAAYGIYSPTGLFVPEHPITGHLPEVGLSILIDSVSQLNKPFDKLMLNPGQKIKKERYLFYGKDVAELQNSTISSGLNIRNYSTAIFKTVDTNNIPINSSFLKVFDDNNNLISFAISNKNGISKIPLVSGKYRFQVSKIGHDTIISSFSISGKTKTILAALMPLTSIEFDIRESKTNLKLPVQLEFKGINGTANPYLGTTKRAEGTNNFYYAINKENFRVPIAPGNYLVTISHGPEYDVIYREVVIRAGESIMIKSEINRSFHSPKWVIADFHNHTAASGDNDSETRSRVINFAGAGIEFAPATEHNRISSFINVIKELGLEEFVASAASIELTGPPGKSPNHENAFPLKIHKGKQGGGFPSIDPSPFVQIKRLFDFEPQHSKFIQHNHPDIPELYFDKNKDGVLDEGYGTRKFTDAIELQESMLDILKVSSEDAKTKDKISRVFYWLQMLNQGDRIFGTTTSDSHIVGPGSGGRFVYVYTSQDIPININVENIAKNSKKGHMIMSNGPFIKVDINGHLPGDEINGTSSLKINIEVFANNKNQVKRVQLLINGKQDSNFNFTQTTHPNLFKQNSLQFKHSFLLDLENDTNIIVVATNDEFGLKPESEDKEYHSIAISNPFFVDIDGNGFIANKDTLGEPLPVFRETTKNN